MNRSTPSVKQEHFNLKYNARLHSVMETLLVVAMSKYYVKSCLHLLVQTSFLFSTMNKVEDFSELILGRLICCSFRTGFRTQL